MKSYLKCVKINEVKVSDDMFNKLYDNCFKSELTTKVLKVEEDRGMYWHACKDTIFFLGNEDMEHDLGTIDHHMVMGLRQSEGYVWHLLDTKIPVGEAVFMSINLHERFRRCQSHTARHLITTIFANIYKATLLRYEEHADCNVLEFDLDGFDERKVKELQTLINGLIRDDLTISILYPTRNEALAYLPQSEVMDDDLRVVRIGSLDYVKCNCMHVPSLRYLQMVYIQSFEKIENGIRLVYLVGDQFLDCVAKRYQVLDTLSSQLNASHLYLESALAQVIGNAHVLHEKIGVWKKRFEEATIKALVQRQEEVIVEELEDVERSSAIAIAREVISQSHKAIVLIARKYDSVCVICGAHPDTNYNYHALYEALLSEYRLKGRSEENFIYGEGLYKESMKNTVLEYIHKH